MEHDEERAEAREAAAEPGEAKEGAAASRSQHLIYVLPQDWAAMTQLLTPAIERVDESRDETQLVFLTPDPHTAVLTSAASVRLAGDRPVDVIPLTSVARAVRLLESRHRRAIAGPPPIVLELVRASKLKLDGVRVLVLAWADQMLDAGSTTAIETLMADVPRDSDRIMVVHHRTDDTDALAERYLRRARRVAEVSDDDSAAPVRVRYVTVSAASRNPALRRVLDDLDPAGASVYVRSDDSEAAATRAVRELGYGADAAVVVTRGAPPSNATHVILYDVPATRQELRAAVGEPERQAIALVQPRQLAGLRTLTGEGALSPLTLTGASEAARTREDRLRDEIRAILRKGVPARELLAVEPLLDEHDGIEIAAAVLRMLGDARDTGLAAEATAPEVAGTGAEADGAWTMVFVNIGSRDGARVNDIVGAVTGQADVPGDAVGKVEMRDTHTLVQIRSPLAQTVISRLTGAMIRGRQLVARLDTGPRGGGDRPFRPRERSFEDRPPRDGRDRPRRDAGDRPPRDGGDRPRRPFGERPRRDGEDRPRRFDERPRRDSGDRPRSRDDRGPRPGSGGGGGGGFRRDRDRGGWGRDGE